MLIQQQQQRNNNEDSFITKDKLQKLKQWITCMIIVKFDLDEGQVIQQMIPQDALSKQECKFISLLSFPDSNSLGSDEEQTQYIIRIKRQQAPLNESFLYGFVYFQQKKDSSNLRGFYQKSIVVLTSHPLMEFFSNLIQIIGQLYFKVPTNDQFLEVYYIDIQLYLLQQRLLAFLSQIGLKLSLILNMSYLLWDNQQEQCYFCFQLNNCKKQLYIPKFLSHLFQNNQIVYENGIQGNGNKLLEQYINFEQSSIQNVLFEQISSQKGYFLDVAIPSILLTQEKINLLYFIWEIILTNQSLMIISDSPQICSQITFILLKKFTNSQTVLASISLISPIEFKGEFRPYFTIYDPDYRYFTNEKQLQKQQNNLILGVTNPLFQKCMKNFKNKLHLEKDYETSLKVKNKNNNSNKQDNGLQQQFLINFFEQVFNSLELTSKIFIQIDKELQNSLLQNQSEESLAINNSLIRKLFRKLTLQFLQPFLIYFQSQKNVYIFFNIIYENFKDVKIFDYKQFIQYLKKQEIKIQNLFTKKSRIMKLYKNFIKSENFIKFVQQQNAYISKSFIEH